MIPAGGPQRARPARALPDCRAREGMRVERRRGGGSNGSKAGYRGRRKGRGGRPPAPGRDKLRAAPERLFEQARSQAADHLQVSLLLLRGQQGARLEDRPRGDLLHLGHQSRLALDQLADALLVGAGCHELPVQLHLQDPPSALGGDDADEHPPLEGDEAGTGLAGEAQVVGELLEARGRRQGRGWLGLGRLRTGGRLAGRRVRACRRRRLHRRALRSLVGTGRSGFRRRRRRRGRFSHRRRRLAVRRLHGGVHGARHRLRSLRPRRRRARRRRLVPCGQPRDREDGEDSDVDPHRQQEGDRQPPALHDRGSSLAPPASPPESSARSPARPRAVQ